MQQHRTQRAEDRTAGLPLTKRMTEDPRKRGVPLFLQVQNRVPLSAERQAALTARMHLVSGGDAARTDFRKPKGMSWEDWDALQEAEAARKKAASYERIEELRARGIIAPAKPRSEHRGPGYKGHIDGSRKALVHEKYDQDGADAARALGAELGLKDGTVKSWIGGWSKAAN